MPLLQVAHPTRMRACPTCHISGPVSLCRSDIREHFGQQVQSCQVRDNCRNGVDSYAQLPRLVVRFLNTSAHRVDWSTEMERLLLAAAEAGKDISPTAYPHAARYLRDALARYPVRAKSVLVGGSITPWVEATLAVAGAGSIQTSDYQERIVDSNITRFIHVGSIEEGSFDAVVSYSSIEHDGLGRYCDPVNPNGDLAAMAEFHHWLKPGGHLFLGVPIGPGEPYRIFGGNRHRIYGSQRFFQNLTRGFELLYSGANVSETWPKGAGAERDAVRGAGMQPVHILQKPMGSHRLHGAMRAQTA